MEHISERILFRKVCSKCGKVYKVKGNEDELKYCYIDGGELVQRSDDNIEWLKKRKREYEERILPIYNFLVKEFEKDFIIDANKTEEGVFKELEKKYKSKEKLYERVSSAILPTKFGTFKIVGYRNRVDYSYHLALVKGEVTGKTKVLTRVHSSCITGDILGSLKCDCGDQLAEALKKIEENGSGILLYLFQEGRGMNILNKIDAYHLQDQGYDTVEANLELGFPDEMREYDVVYDILEDLGVKSINLMTNNPDKINKLSKVGVVVEERVPIILKCNSHNEKYLKTKKEKMNHLL